MYHSIDCTTIIPFYSILTTISYFRRVVNKVILKIRIYKNIFSYYINKLFYPTRYHKYDN